MLASDKLGLPTLLNLCGYVIGALILSPLADRFGRRDILLVTLIITGLGSLLTAFVQDYTTFIIARVITGIGVGADLALVATYINEVAPSNGRAKYTSLIFIMSSLGAFLGIWLGLILTTPAANFPLGLPFAQATVQVVHGLPQFAGSGWRWMYGIGALLALVGIVLRFRLPESPRWLITQGRVEEADEIVTDMEQRAMKRLVNSAPGWLGTAFPYRREARDLLGNSGQSPVSAPHAFAVQYVVHCLYHGLYHWRRAYYDTSWPGLSPAGSWNGGGDRRVWLHRMRHL